MDFHRRLVALNTLALGWALNLCALGLGLAIGNPVGVTLAILSFSFAYLQGVVLQAGDLQGYRLADLVAAAFGILCIVSTTASLLLWLAVAVLGA